MPEIELARRRRLQPMIEALGAGAALITSLPNVRYLTGLASSNAALLLPATGDAAVLATDWRYAGAARRDAADLELLTERFIEPALARLATERQLTRLAFEAQEMTVQRHQEFAAAAPGLDLVPLSQAVEQLRVVKDEAEIALLAQACAITSQAFDQIIGQIRPGLSWGRSSPPSKPLSLADRTAPSRTTRRPAGRWNPATWSPSTAVPGTPATTRI
jgi:Xaa-Pro aminopeptidase